MKKIIINSKFSTHQKLVLTVLFLVTFFLGSLSVLAIITGFYRENEAFLMDYITPLLFPLSIYLFILLFSKQGVLFDEGKLKYAEFIFETVFAKKEIDLTNITDISILTYNVTQKFAFVSGARPDLAEDTALNKVYVLNENHSKKIFVLSTRKRKFAEKIVDEISKELNFKFKKYSPPRVSRRRR
jgi:hypothetical protein